MVPGVVGASVPRVDAVPKVRGRARFVDDLPLDEHTRFGCTVWSTVPHGVLRGIRLDPGFDWNGITVATAADIPGRNCILLDSDDQPCLVAVGDHVRHAAQAVALVAAPTRDLARRAAAHVVLDVDPLPAVLGIEDALRNEVAVTATGDNVLRDVHIGRGDVDAAFAAADLIVEGTYRTGAAEHAYLEPQGMIAAWGDAGRLRVVGSLQCPYYVHRALGAVFDLDERSVEVAQATTGGGFGGKEDYPSMLAAHAALLARCTRTPVKMVYERGEDIAATTKRHPSLIHHRIAVGADGRLMAADVDVILDAGAFVTLSPVVLLRAVLHATGPYRFDAVRVRGRAVATNHPPSGAFRGFGAPQALFAAERQMAKVCAALGADPIVFRREHALRPGDLTPTGGTVDHSAGLVAALDALAERLDEPPPHAGRKGSPTARRGRGIAAAFHGAGFTGNGEALMKATATVALTADGSVQVLTSCVDMGQGARTVLAQLAADAMEVELATIDVPEPSTRDVPDTGPTVASRTTLVAGTVVQRAARRLRDELQVWGEENGLDPSDVTACARAAAAAHHLPSVTEQYAPTGDVVWDQATLTGDAYPTYAWSATAVDVAVDEDTDEVTVERCIQVVDAGRAINPMSVEGQIHGGTLQALGWALLEHVERPGGVVTSPSLTTTIVPTAADAPEVEAVIVEVPFADGPAGAKGIGELPLDGPAAAVANAVADALGVAVDQLPLLPEVLHRLVATEGAR